MMFYLRYIKCDIGCDLVAVKNDIVYFIIFLLNYFYFFNTYTY